MEETLFCILFAPSKPSKTAPEVGEVGSHPESYSGEGRGGGRPTDNRRERRERERERERERRERERRRMN